MKEQWVAKVNGSPWAYKSVCSDVELEWWKDSVASVLNFQDQKHGIRRNVTFEKAARPVRGCQK